MSTDAELSPAVPCGAASVQRLLSDWPTDEVFVPAGFRVHMIGIGGCGMRGAAHVLLHAGAIVSGSDRSSSTALELLGRAGAVVHTGQQSANLPEECDFVVHSAAIGETNPELVAARARGIPVIKYARLLGMLMSRGVGIAVAGTHGKSTTTAMVSYCLREAQLDPCFVIGAGVEQLGGGSGVGDGDHFVVEACEYDRSFLNLNPRLAAILNIEEDHLDYYRDLDEIVEAFSAFSRRVPCDGRILVNGDDPSALKAVSDVPAKVETFGFSDRMEWQAKILDETRGCQRFTVLRHHQPLTEVQLSLPGRHNVSNALAAMALCFHCGVEPETIAIALGAFRGAHRRLTLRGVVDEVTVVDDYAHHPSEIQVTLSAARTHYQPRKLYVVFQPHQHSRTRFLLNDFTRSFDAADVVIVPDIYFVRDSETERDLIDARDLVDRLNKRGTEARYEPDFTAIATQLCREVKPGDLVMTMGAGDVYRVADALLTCLHRHRGGGEIALLGDAEDR